MQTDSGKWAGAGVKGRTDGENNGQGVVQGRPSLLPHKTQHTAWPWPLLLSGEYSLSLAPLEQSQGHLPGGQGQARAEGGEQGDGAPLLQKEHKTLQLPAARNFGFCFQASTSGKLPRGGDMDCSLR